MPIHYLKLTIYLLFPVLTTLLSCSGGKSSAAENDDTDSLANTALEEQPVVITRLPDTVYASVNAVNYTTKVYDKSIDPEINSLTDMYADTPGSFTFRKGIHRQANFGGTITGRPTKIDVEWTFQTDFVGTWGGGSGWTGQPLYIEWPDSCMQRLRAASAIKDNASNHEIMVGSLCGNVYFIDYETGKASREPICVNNPVKGTMSIDPSLNGNLYVGQGVPDNRPFGALTINLYNNKISHFFPEDPEAQRAWGAYDSSPVRMGQFLFRPGENGTLYKWLIGDGTLKLQAALRYKVNGSAPGIESSMAIYRNYGYTADNHGNILCVNLDTMKPVWCVRVGDDIDSSIVLIEEDSRPYIYTGCEIDRQVEGTAKYLKIDGIDGSVKWTLEVQGKQRKDGEKNFDGGFYSSALPGVANCDSLLFVNCVLNTNDKANGEFLAIRRATGEIAYRVPTNYYAWSSPVGFVNEKNEMFVVTGDCAGNIYLINGIDGKIIYTKRIGDNFESSPVVVGNKLVVGSRGTKIFKMSVN